MGKCEIEKFIDWLTDKELSQNTIDVYSYAVKEFFELYKELTKRNLIDYKRHLLESGKSPKTVNLRCIAMNQYCVFVGSPELSLKNVKIHKQVSVENVISKDDYQKLLSCLKSDGDMRGYFMIKFLANTGARVSEFIKFKKNDLEKGYCEIWTKGKIRRINFPDALIEESKNYFATVTGDLLFPNRYGEMLTTRGVASRINQMSDKYGIDRDVMHPHSFRHLFAIEFLKSNNNIALLADLLGHESVNTTAIYLKLSEAEQREQLNNAVNW